MKTFQILQTVTYTGEITVEDDVTIISVEDISGSGQLVTYIVPKK